MIQQMGLDAVELVMAVEKSYGIEISDSDLYELSTVGAFYEYILRRLERGQSSKWTEEAVWATLQDIAVEQLAVERGRVTPEANWKLDLGMD